MEKLKSITIIALCFLLSACENGDYLSQVTRFEKHVKNNKLGSTSDFWLVKHSSYTKTYDKIALVFGTLNDADLCRELVQLYTRKHPEGRYYCFKAN